MAQRATAAQRDIMEQRAIFFVTIFLHAVGWVGAARGASALRTGLLEQQLPRLLQPSALASQLRALSLSQVLSSLLSALAPATSQH